MLEGANVDTAMLAYRLEVLELFLSTSTPINRIDGFRHLLERDRYRLTAADHMRNYIPDLRARFLSSLCADLSGVRGVSLIFDGTSHLGELFVVNVRFWSDFANCFKQKLLRLRHSEFALNTETMAAILLNALERSKISVDNVIGAIHDSAAYSKFSLLLAHCRPRAPLLSAYFRAGSFHLEIETLLTVEKIIWRLR